MARIITLLRATTAVAAVGAACGAVLMFIIGARSTYNAVDIYFSGHADAKGHAAIDATRTLVASLDEFLFGLVLLFFAYGVLVLFIIRDQEAWQRRVDETGIPPWMQIRGLGDLKAKLLEVVVVLFAVSFLDVALEEQSRLEWSLLVLPIAMVATGAVVWLLRRSETEASGSD
jgi:uncharacterized membrane protein YqhA